MENLDQKKFRVVTVLTKEEKEDLKVLAWDSQRSMSSYIRFLVIQEIDRYSE
jgi:hypothetical protein